MNELFAHACARFDSANAEDPHRELAGGVEQPKELLYSRRMSATLDRFEPGASEIVRLAVRAQHIRRWVIPRDEYPMDRDGYRAWRAELAGFHAETASEILRDVGYDEQTVARVGTLLRKERLKADPEVQLLEDVACLVFLEHYLEPFASRQEPDKLLGIVRKTWRKMSERGRRAARELTLAPGLREIVSRALEGS